MIHNIYRETLWVSAEKEIKKARDFHRTRAVATGAVAENIGIIHG